MFNKEKFADVLYKIIDTYNSQREFASISDVNRTSLSKYMNKKIDKPPLPRMLEKIAEYSNGVISYPELLQICGYVPSNNESFSQSLEIQLTEFIYNINEPLLEKFNLTQSALTDLKSILVNRNELDSSVEAKLNNFAIYNSSDSKELYSLLLKINNNITSALINLQKNGYLYPVPVYKNAKNIDLFPISNIVDYINFNIPINNTADDFFALLIDNDKMLPLLDIDDIAIIHKEYDFINGQIVACYSTTEERCIIGKLFKYDNIIELSFLNSKSKKFINSDIKFLGKVIKAEVKSAFR